MAERIVNFIQYNDLELHPLLDEKHEWFLTLNEVAKAFEVDTQQILELKTAHEDALTQGRHYQMESVISGGKKSSELMLWSKKGIIRLAYYLRNDAGLRFLDFAEDLNLQSTQTGDTQSASMYDEVEANLLTRLKQLRENENMSLEELNRLIFTVDNLATKKAALRQQKQETSPLEGILSGVMKMLQVDPGTAQSGMGSFIQKVTQERTHEPAVPSVPADYDPFESMKPLNKIDSKENEEKPLQ